MCIKNKLSLFLAVIMAITFTVPAYALEKSTNPNMEDTNLYIITDSVPDEAINHTK